MKSWISHSLLAVFLLVMSVYLYKKQAVNWDIEAYMGIVLKIENPQMPIRAVHQSVYRELRIQNPQLFNFRENAGEQPDYYAFLAAHPAAYGEELELFRVKPFYNFVNFVFYKLGATPASATFFTNVLSYGLLIIFLYLFFIKVLQRNFFALVLAVSFGLFRPVLDAARQATPDMLGTFLLIFSLYLLIFRKNYVGFAAAGICTVFTRPEFSVFFAIIFIAILCFARRSFRIFPLSVAFLMCFLAFAEVQIFNKISWQTLVMNQFIKFQFYPVSHPDVFSAGEYLAFVRGSFILDFNSSFFPIIILVYLIVIGNSFKISYLKDYNLRLYFIAAAAVLAFVLVRYFIFPTFVSRMMAVFYLILLINLLLYLHRLHTQNFNDRG